MKEVFTFFAAIAICFTLTNRANADLDSFLADLNRQAIQDRVSYNARLSNQFGVPLSQVESIVNKVDSPAHAFMLLELGVMSGKPFEIICDAYKSNQGKGWGVIAQQLGIKPGSPEFHALKEGDFIFSGKPGEKGYKHYNDKEKGKGINLETDTLREMEREREMEQERGRMRGKKF